MEIELVTGKTKEQFEQNIEEKKAEGWEVYGEGGILEPKLESSITDMPQFIYYWRFMIKEN